MSDKLLPALVHAFQTELDAALGRIVHCTKQLSDDEIWWRPRDDMNSIGNLILHLTGNIKQMIVSAVGGAPNERDRPAEFAARDPIAKANLLGRLNDAVDSAKRTIAAATPDDLTQVKLTNNANMSGIEAIVRSTAHFRGHAQEIIHQTRTILGEGYQYAGMK